MANFTTHLTVAVITSTALVMFGFLGGLFGFGAAIFCLMMGVIGGLLPDIDLETSIPAKRFFVLISLFVATLSAILYTTYEPTAIQLTERAFMVWCVVFLVMRYGVIGLFNHLTVHRGMIHSVPYMVMCGLFVVHGAFYGFGMTAKLSWLLGGFLFIGAMVHLALDELYSVNVLGLRLKKSAGTALKFFESKKPLRYIILYIIVLLLFLYAPDYQPALNSVRVLMQAWIQKFAPHAM